MLHLRSLQSFWICLWFLWLLWLWTTWIRSPFDTWKSPERRLKQVGLEWVKKFHTVLKVFTTLDFATLQMSHELGFIYCYPAGKQMFKGNSKSTKLRFHSPVLLIYVPWKHQKFSDVFRRYRKATPDCYGLNTSWHKRHKNDVIYDGASFAKIVNCF